MDTMKRVEAAYRRGNLEAAGVILEDIAKYGGESSGLVKWARLVAHRTCAMVAGGETCRQCGLAAYPGHRPEMAGETFCSACCPACRPECGDGTVAAAMGGD
jgi:hypothetical protein